MLDAYYTSGVAQLAELGGPDLDPSAFKNEFWQEVDKYLPPTGRIVNARTADGTLLGYGMLKTIGPSVGELKRLYVSPKARGQRLGLQLIEARIEAAREMGLETLKADTWKNNRPMLALYEALGFHYVDLSPDSATYKLVPHVAPFMVFLEKHLDA